MYIAACAWLLLVVGYFNRHLTSRHVPLMLTGIVLDLGLVAFLQITRSAVQTAIAFELSLLEQLHIGFSTAAVLLYFPTLYLGYRLVRGDRAVLSIHKKVGSVALLLRTLGFVFMFSMWKP